MSDDLTLVFELSALRRLADPAAALADARTWATHVGAVFDESPERITEFAARADIRLDFATAATGESGGLGVLRQQYPTWRHVVVGTADEHRAAAREHGWEYIDLGAAAEKAGWELAAADDRWRESRDEADATEDA